MDEIATPLLIGYSQILIVYQRNEPFLPFDNEKNSSQNDQCIT